jgi:hypothetical protein
MKLDWAGFVNAYILRKTRVLRPHALSPSNFDDRTVARLRFVAAHYKLPAALDALA